MAKRRTEGGAQSIKTVMIKFYDSEIDIVKDTMKHCIDIDTNFTDYLKKLLKEDYNKRRGITE